MTLHDHARAAVLAGGNADLRIGQALEVLRAFDEARAEGLRESAAALNAERLPYPKDTIKWALLVLLGAIERAPEREPLKAAFVSLSEWQLEADIESGGFDSGRLRRKLDPLRLAHELAARATPADRRLAAVRDEQAALIAELRRKGFW